jgi:pleiotropic regulator 1
LETNKIVRHYHGHMQGAYALSLHPTLDVLVTGARDRTARVWDMRTKVPVHVLVGHDSAVASVITNATEPQVITGGLDATIRVSRGRGRGGGGGGGGCMLNTPPPLMRVRVRRPQFWDIRTGKPRTVLTHHKKGVRALASHSRDFVFLSAAADSIRKWALPDGVLATTFRGHDSIVNALAISEDDVVVSGGDDGTLR